MASLQVSTLTRDDGSDRHLGETFILVVPGTGVEPVQPLLAGGFYVPP